MTTGERIRTRRKQLGMSVDDLAAKLGKNRATIYRYESDAIEMPASLLKPLADALDTVPDELMDWGSLLVSEAERQDFRLRAKTKSTFWSKPLHTAANWNLSFALHF